MTKSYFICSLQLGIHLINMKISQDLTAQEFISLSKSVGWGVNRQYDLLKVDAAIGVNYVIRNDDGEALACMRIFSDDILMTFIPDIFVNPKYKRQGLGKKLMKAMIKDFGHTKIFFGAQKESEAFFESLGFKKSVQSYEGKFNSNPYIK